MMFIRTRQTRTPMWRAVLFASLLLLGGGLIGAWLNADGGLMGFGPTIHPWPAEGKAAVASKPVPNVQARVLSVPRSKAISIRRVDPEIPASQSWESSIVAVDHDPSTASDDEVVVTWMLGLSAPPLTDTRIGLATSRNGGATWTRGELAPPPNATNIQFDPMSTVNPQTGRIHLAAMSRHFTTANQNALWIADKPAGAQAFAPSRTIRPATATDKGWMAAGPLPNGQQGSAVYMVYNGPGAPGTPGLSGVAQVSLDDGQTFSSPLPISGPGSIGHHPRVNAQGVLSVTYYDNGVGKFVRARGALDGFDTPVTVAPFAATPQAFQIAVAGEFRIPYFLMHAIDPRNGRIYVVYNDVTGFPGGESDVDLLMRDSRDGGATWSAIRNISEDPALPADQYLPWLEVDSTGTLHLAYYDTRRTTGSDSGLQALVDVYYASSSDEGQSWVTQRLTDTPLDSTRTNWSPGGFPSQFVGDYIGMSVTSRAIYIAYPGAAADGVAMNVAKVDRGPAGNGIDGGHTGTWLNFAENGHGMLIEVLDDNRMLAWWYTFQPGGGQAWFGGIGTYAGQVATIPTVRAEGARFLPQFNPNDITLGQLGTMTITFESCLRARVDYNFGQGFGSGSWTMDRLTVPKGLTCSS